MEIISWIMANYMIVLQSLLAILGGLLAISLIIPGPQPEKFLSSVIELLSKFSKK